jgi:hypothetical protein
MNPKYLVSNGFPNQLVSEKNIDIDIYELILNLNKINNVRSMASCSGHIYQGYMMDLPYFAFYTNRNITIALDIISNISKLDLNYYWTLDKNTIKKGAFAIRLEWEKLFEKQKKEDLRDISKMLLDISLRTN